MKRDELKIQSPCHENYDAMSGDGPRRFCASCSTHVTNLSDMTREDAQAFVEASRGQSVCIRYRFDQTGNVTFAPSRPRRSPHVRQLLMAAAAVVVPLLTACDHAPGLYNEPTPLSAMVEAEENILALLGTSLAEVNAFYDEVWGADPFEEVVMGEMAVIDPIDPEILEEPCDRPSPDVDEVYVMGDWLGGPEPEIEPEPEVSPETQPEVIPDIGREHQVMGRMAFEPQDLPHVEPELDVLD